MRHLDLFSGIGGFALAAKWTWGDEYENIGHSEIEKFPCKIYHKHFLESECLGDITKIDWERFKGKVDLLTGGFPCQPHSIAGKRKASADERDLWSECVRALRGIRPDYALFENVPELLRSERGAFFNRLLADLRGCRYDAEWQTVSAKDIGANHERKRIWILAYPDGQRCGASGLLDNLDEICRDKIWYAKKNFKQWSEWKRWIGETFQNGDWSETDAEILGMDDALSLRVDRIKGLGNAIVPQVAQVIMEAIKEFSPLKETKQ